MATDDSFAFSKVVGNIKTLITELPDVESGAGASIDQEEQALVRLLPQSGAPSPAPSSPSGGAWSEVEALAMRRAALLDCVCAGRGCYAHAWARTSVDLLVDHAVAHAKRFLPSQRDALQAMATFVREQRAARKLVGAHCASSWHREPLLHHAWKVSALSVFVCCVIFIPLSRACRVLLPKSPPETQPPSSERGRSGAGRM